MRRPCGRMLNPSLGAHVLKSALGPGLAPPSLGGANAATFAARMEAVKNSPLEAQLVGPMWYDAAGVNPATTSAAALELVSPLRRANARKVLEVQEGVQRRLAENGMCLYEAEAPEPSSMPALGKLFERKFGIFDPAASQADQAQRANRMWNYVRGRMHYGVLLHEMGHTIGERHNFTSSFDKFNYRPQYWQLRSKVSSSGQGVTTECTDSTTDATGQELRRTALLRPADSGRSRQLHLHLGADHRDGLLGRAHARLARPRHLRLRGSAHVLRRRGQREEGSHLPDRWLLEPTERSRLGRERFRRLSGLSHSPNGGRRNDERGHPPLLDVERLLLPRRGLPPRDRRGARSAPGLERATERRLGSRFRRRDRQQRGLPPASRHVLRLA